MKKITKNLGVAMLAGALAFGASAVSFAAEDAGGVAKYIGLSFDEAKVALDHLKAGRKDDALSSLKKVRQYTKEITGDAAGMKLQKVNQAVKATILDVEGGDLNKAAETLTPAVTSLDEIKKSSGK